jgi:mycothiol synthase
MDTKTSRMNLFSSPVVDYRGFQGEQDFPNILAVIEGSKVEDGLTRSDSLEDIRLNYAHLHNSDPYKDMLFAEVGGQVVGYCRTMWDLDLQGEWRGSYLAFVLPQWRRLGIGTAFIRFSEERLRQIADELLAKDDLPAQAPRLYEVFVGDKETAKAALHEKMGYQVVRYFCEMRRPDLEDIPSAVLPPGLEVRPVHPEHYRQVWDASVEAFRDHWGVVEPPESEYEKMLLEPTFNPALWQVAWDGDQIAGMVLNFINHAENEEYQRRRGYTENICVRRPWRRRGLARALLLRSLQVVKDQDMEEAALFVDAENLSGALRLYESVGFQIIKRNRLYRKPLD